VVLPDPFRPMTAQIRPAAAVMWIPEMTVVLPYPAERS